MSLKLVHDVFIAYHGSYNPNGSKKHADKVYEYLTQNGIDCFYFPVAKKDVYKANIIESMRSKTFLLVCSNGLNVLENGRIDNKHHYELSTEIDSFYALTQIDEREVGDAKVLACGDYYKGNETAIHELFANRVHLYDDDPNYLEKILNWVKERIKKHETWQNEQKVTSEIQEVFATRASVHQHCHFDDLVANAKMVKAVGISNSELTSRINPKAVENCLNNGGQIEILFLDPDGQHTPLREEEESLKHDRIKMITKINIDTALGMKEDYATDCPQNFRLYTYDKLPRLNLIFIDDNLIVQYYANNIPGIKNPSFYIKKQDSSPLFDFCEQAYEYLKQDAIEIEE